MIDFQQCALSLSRNGDRVLRFDFRLEEGDFAVMLGPNGSGKTSLLEVGAGVIRPDSGVVQSSDPNSPVAYAVQDPNSGLMPWRTVSENILLPSELARKGNATAKNLALSWLGELGLGTRINDYPYLLSGGEKQMVNLVRTICTPAITILLDEPFAPLNPTTRTLAKRMLLEFVRNRTVLMVTHDPADLDLPFTRYFGIEASEVREITWQKAVTTLSSKYANA